MRIVNQLSRAPLIQFVISDSIESFISDITQRRQEKFNQLRRENTKRNQMEVTPVEGNDVIDKIHNCLDARDEDELTIVIDSWLEKPANTLPRSVIGNVLAFASSVGNRELFKKLIAHAKHCDSPFYEENFSLIETLYLELDWRTGKNIDQLIEKFELMYKRNISDELLTKRMEKLCSIMIVDCVEKKGESVVVKLKEKLEQMCEESKDYRLLYDLWRNLFER